MSSPLNSSGIPSGFLPPQGNWGDYNIYSFIVLQWLAKVQTAIPVKILSCTNDGSVVPFGFVDVLPLVNQIDSQGNAVPHSTVYNLPYLRMQGGSNAIILDPQAGDIGIAVFASRDISKVKATQAQANPDTFRKFSYADGMYLGGILNGTPTQFIQFNSTGITIVSPTQINLVAPNINIHATSELKYDCEGNGTKFTPNTRTDYVIGSTGSSEPLNPPEIP